MNAPLRSITLEDKYALGQGRVFLTGTQALVRLLLLQHQRDAMAGMNTAGYVSGYRGSPLGGLDQALSTRAGAFFGAPEPSAYQPYFSFNINKNFGITGVGRRLCRFDLERVRLRFRCRRRSSIASVRHILRGFNATD